MLMMLMRRILKREGIFVRIPEFREVIIRVINAICDIIMIITKRGRAAMMIMTIKLVFFSGNASMDLSPIPVAER